MRPENKSSESPIFFTIDICTWKDNIEQPKCFGGSKVSALEIHHYHFYCTVLSPMGQRTCSDPSHDSICFPNPSYVQGRLKEFGGPKQNGHGGPPNPPPHARTQSPPYYSPPPVFF